MIVTVDLKYLCAPVLVSIFVSFRGSICFIRGAYISLSRVAASAVGAACGFLFIYLFIPDFFLKRIFLIPVVHAERRRRTAGLVQAWRGSIRHFSPFARRAATRGKSGGSLGMF